MTNHPFYQAAKSAIEQYPNRSAIAILLALAFFTRFLFIGHPGSAVFDEVHFNFFAGFYYSGQYYYDIHPPLGKLLLAAVAYPFGGIEQQDIVRQISVEYTTGKYLVLRMWPAFIGSLLPLLLFGVARELKLSYWSSLCIGLLAVLDNAIMLQSRLILLDAMLLCFGFAALWIYLVARRLDNMWLMMLSAVFAGSSFSIKWIGVSFTGLIGLVIIADWIKALWFNGWRPKWFYVGCGYLVVSVSIYMMSFFVHFSLLPISHKQGDQFMTAHFQSELEGSRYQNATGTVSGFTCPKNYTHKLTYGMPNTQVSPAEALACKVQYAPIKKLNFFQKFAELNVTMYTTNQGLKQSHPDASPWYSWPIMARPLYYWHHDGARIYLLGNPFVWWISICGVILLLVGQIVKSWVWSHPRLANWYGNESFWVSMIGFWASLLPFMMVSRVMFMYHYLTALCFSLIISGVVLDRLSDFKYLRVIWLGLAVFGFVLVSPLTYGLNWFGSDMLWFLRMFGWHP